MSNPATRHIFICTNLKKDGKGCASLGADEAFQYLKQVVAEKSHLFKQEKGRVKVVKTSCLGRCSIGPNLLISPENVWCSFSSQQDLDKLIEQYFIESSR